MKRNPEIKKFVATLNIDWSKTPCIEDVRSTDYIWIFCEGCEVSVKKQVSNMFKNYKNKIPITCRSCGGKRSITPEAQAKYKQTMLEKYGVDNPNKCPKIREKTRKTVEERYGPGGAIGVARASFSEKYGVDNPFRLESVKKKIKETNLEKYGVEHRVQLPEIHKKGITRAAKLKTEKRNYEIDLSEISCSYSENPKQWFSEYVKLRRKHDPEYKIKAIIYRNIARMIKGEKIGKTKLLKDIGYTTQEFRDHIAPLFQSGMSWENHGEWHVDHIRPLTSFKLNDIEEIKKANALENLQPLWASDNIRKSNKY